MTADHLVRLLAGDGYTEAPMSAIRKDALGSGRGISESALRYIDQEPQVFRISFGDPVKLEVAERFSFPLSLCYSQEGKDEVVLHPDLPGAAMTVREIMQWWGTDIRRKQDPGYWVNKMREHVRSIREDDVLVIDDVRFPDEAYFCQKIENGLPRQRGGMLIRLHTYNGWKPGPHARHESETALDGFTGWDLQILPCFGELELAARVIMDEWRAPSAWKFKQEADDE